MAKMMIPTTTVGKARAVVRIMTAEVAMGAGTEVLVTPWATQVLQDYAMLLRACREERELGSSHHRSHSPLGGQTKKDD